VGCAASLKSNSITPNVAPAITPEASAAATTARFAAEEGASSSVTHSVWPVAAKPYPTSRSG
jgi:hypothetical protein